MGDLRGQRGATTLAHLNNQEAQKDAVPWGAACNALDPSRFKYQVPLSPRGAQGSSLECGHPEVPPPPPSAASREPLCMDPPPRALRGGTEGAQPNEGPKSRTQEHRGAPASRKSSAIPENICHKFGSKVVDQLVSEEQKRCLKLAQEPRLHPGNRQMLCPGFALRRVVSVPRLHGLLAAPQGWSWHLLPKVGPPQETKSLMKASYTPEVIEKSVRDVGHWHGRRTDDLGRWHQKNAMNMNLQKALEEKYGEKSKAKNLKF
ncbi:testis expressed 33 [Ictidomys tridecemlineatus]|nr:testis expressed 33 [Ictidomys tridecemlineatus]